MRFDRCSRRETAYGAAMLSDFLDANRDELLAQARLRVAVRNAPRVTELELTLGLPIFLDQLQVALRRASVDKTSDHAALGKSAEQHGYDLFRQGLTIGQVVHDYGDLCQVITGLAAEQRATIDPREFQTLNLCLDDAIAGAVTEYERQHERAVDSESSERLGILAHEMRNLLNSAIVAVASMKRGIVGVSGSTAAILDRSLMGMQVLIDRSLAEVRLEAGLVKLTNLPVLEVIDEVVIGTALFAEKRNLRLVVGPADHTAIVAADRQLLAAALTNLLQNAFKFTVHGSTVSLNTTTTSERVLIAVQDECGGLPPGGGERLLQPFSQHGQDRTGLGLGLSICVKAMQSMSGELHVRDLPGKGCIFMLDLPKQSPDAVSNSPDAPIGTTA